MAKAGGSLPGGRRTRDEVPPVPDASALWNSNSELRPRCAGSSKTPAGGSIPPALFRHNISSCSEPCSMHGPSATGSDLGTGCSSPGRPGLWHALDDLYPLQDPNRWDHLRLATIRHLENRGWQRRTPPRGSAFDIPLTAP